MAERLRLRRGRGRRSANLALITSVSAALALVAGLLTGLPGTSSALTPQLLAVSASATPASGTTVDPGATVTYTLNAKSQAPLPNGATVVDDLSGLLGDATIATSGVALAQRGLTFDTNTKRLTWTLPALGAPGTSTAAATTSFQATVAAAAPAGARLTTAAAPAGDTCAAGSPCATTLTVAGPTSATTSTTTTTTTAPAGKTAMASVLSAPALSTTTTTRPTTTTTTATTPRAAPAARASAKPRAGCTEAQSSNATVVAGFEIDGNLCVNTPGNLDWSNVGGQPVEVDPFYPNDNTAFTGGADETDWPWTFSQLNSTVNNGSSQQDLGQIFAHTEVSNNQVYAFFGFTRRASGSGTFAIWVELDQLPNRPPAGTGTLPAGSSSPVPNRTTGDLRLTFTQAGTGPIGLTGAATWSSSGTGGWVSLGSLAGFNGATNSVPVTDLSGNTLAPFTFAEVAVNLTTLFGSSTTNNCSGDYGVLNVRSSASDTATSSLIDWVNPVDLSVPSTCASVRVDKSWNIDGTTYANGSQPPGFSSALTLTGQTNPQFGVTYDTQSNGTHYLAGQTVTVGEADTLPSGCTNAPTGAGDKVLVPGLNSFQVTNTVTCTHLTLQKVVVGGSATPDRWTLTAAGPTTGISGPTGSATVTAVRVAPGAYTLTETTAVTGYRQTSLTCAGATLAGDTVTVALHNNVTCTFTNTAIYPVVLTKAWVNPVTGDTTSLAIHVGTSTATGSSTAPATTTPATLTALAGDSVSLSETPGSSNVGSYRPTLACDNGVTPTPTTGPSGSFTVPGTLGAGTTITCTFTNTRTQAQLTLEKDWVNGAAGDTADLSVTGTDSGATTVTVPDGGTGVSSATVTVDIFSGETTNLAETLPGSGHTNVGTYTSRLACTEPGLGTVSADGRSAPFTVPSTPVNVVCTFINTRTQATLTLAKAWVNGATGDTAGLSIDGAPPTTATVPTGGTGPSTATTTATVLSGQSVSLAETLPAPAHTNTGTYTSGLACSQPGLGSVSPEGTNGTFTVPAAPANVSCTFTNTRTVATLTLVKAWVNGATGDTAHLSITGASPTTSGSNTSTATGGSETDTGHPATATVYSGQAVTLAETLPAAGHTNTGTYTSTLACGGTTIATGTTGTFTVPATPANVTCTFTNTRTQATLTLRKDWGNGATGDTAGLSIDGAPPTTATVPTGGTGLSTATSTATVFSGQDVSLTETLPAPAHTNTGTYTSALACDGTSIATGTGGTFTVPPAPADVTCTFTNTRTEAKLTLEKVWDTAVVGDRANLIISGSDSATSGSAVALVPPSGSGLSTATATAPIFSGGTVSVNEELPDTNTGAYTSQISCTPSTGFTPGTARQGGTIIVSSPPVDTTCTITNTRATTGELTLQKTWVNGAPGDTADLSATGVKGSGTATAVVPDSGNGTSVDKVVVPTTVNETVSLAEVLPGAGHTNVGTYTSTLACDGTTIATGTTGTFTVPATPANALCTFTNTRTMATVTLRKMWVNGAPNDSADLSITGTDAATSGAATATVPGSGTGLSTATATAPIFSGGTVFVNETLPADAHTNTGTYTSTLSCDNSTSATGTSGSFVVASPPTSVVCTFTNTRTSATVTLIKAWDNGAAGDTAALSVTGTGPTVSAANTSTATGVAGLEPDGGHPATATVYSGQTINLAETLPAPAHTNVGTYTAALSCDNSTTANGTSGSFTVPATPVDVACTFTNTRTSATLTLVKEWVNGAAGDTADLSITGTSPPTSGANTSTATGAAGPETDSAHPATTTVFSGQTLTLAEVLPGAGHTNVGTYTSTLACDGTTIATGTTGTFTVPATPANALCTFTNTRTMATVELTKAWVNPITGDEVELTITDGTRFGVGSSIAPATTTNASLDVFSGDTVGLTEDFLVGLAANYDTTLACNNGVSVTGGSFVVPGTPPTTITCTFTNTRKQATLTLLKQWEQGITGDQAGLSITGTDLATGDAPTSTAIATVPAGGTGLSSESASAPIFSGETVTVNEDLPPAGHTNAGAYDSSITCTPPDGFTPGTGRQGGTIVVPSTPVDVTCTITNTRAQTGILTLQKAWVNAFPTDTAQLTASGVLGSGTVTATVPGLGTGTAVDKVILPISQPETVNLAEILGASNFGTYISALTCDQPGLTVSPDGRSGTLAVTSAEAVLCTFTNSAAAPDPQVTKTVTSNTQNADGTWTTVYDVAVTNPDPTRPTAFTLTDTLAFGANIIIHSATVTGTGASPTWNGSTDTTVVANGPLGPGVTEHYIVTVNATVLADATTADRLCAEGGGFLNRAGVALPANISSGDPEAEACADPSSPTITKKVGSVVAGPTAGHWVVTYDVVVTNGSLTQLSYSLHDQLGFPAGVTITSTSASRVHSALDGSGATAPEAIPGWSGTGTGTTLASNRPIPAQSKDTYTIVVGATVPTSLTPEELACSTSGAGHGYFNSGTLTSGRDEFHAEACDDIMPTPVPPPPPPTVPVAPPSPITPGPIPVTG